MSAVIQEQVRRRRTFAIISHPDAGKTTLTEKLPDRRLGEGAQGHAPRHQRLDGN